MTEEVREVYNSLINTLTIKDLNTVYDRALSDLEEEEYLHYCISGLLENQKLEYERLKDELSVYSILEQEAEQAVFDHFYEP